jgi:hypothetical protein
LRLKNTFPVTDIDLPGTDADYLEWIRTLPSCITGQYSEYVNGDGRNPACHVRRSKSFGTGYKAPFSAIPLTNDQHAVQTVSGEAACLNMYHGHRMDWIAETAKDYFDRQLEFYRKQWTERCLG